MYLIMALRVLLADESSTIKKAIQMALSDLGVEVKSVPSGLDVLTVSRSFQPDLILADILLTKKNGYEVCAEIKSDAMLKQTPVILMWSSFMQLDQTQFQKVKADASLEKPFDSESLRNLVEKFVPKTNQFPLKGLLNHPELPDFEESDTFVKQRNGHQISEERTMVMATPPVEPPAENASKNQIYQMKSSALSNQDAIDEMDDFAELPLKPKRPRPDQSDDWESGTPEDFVVETESYGDFEEVTVMQNVGGTDSTPDLQKRIQEQLNSYIDDAPLAKNRSQMRPENTSSRTLSNLEEQILKEEIRMLAEKICWQILPDITEKIVREELGKLLNGLEKS